MGVLSSFFLRSVNGGKEVVRDEFVYYNVLHMSSLTIRIPDSLRRELKKLCRREGKPMSDVVRDSLQRYVAAEQFASLRKRTLPFAEAQGYLTDEDVFKAIS
jgi:predicted transcriptional regulator